MRRFQNARRTEARRKAQRDRAQARIARAARERAAHVRLTIAEERSRENLIVFTGDEEKVGQVDRLIGGMVTHDRDMVALYGQKTLLTGGPDSSTQKPP